MSIIYFYPPWRKSKDGSFLRTVKNMQFIQLLSCHIITFVHHGYRQVYTFYDTPIKDVLVILYFANNVGHIFIFFFVLFFSMGQSQSTIFHNIITLTITRWPTRELHFLFMYAYNIYYVLLSVLHIFAILTTDIIIYVRIRERG